jgi:hypothetical protein
MNENELRVNPRPWMTDDSIDFIESKLRPTDTVIEFGGGWSSLFWAKRSAFTLTVEANWEWASKIIMEMSSHPDLMTKWQLKFVPSDWNPDESRLKPYWENNKQFLSPAICSEMTNRYLSIDFDPDIFVIDGSIRPENIKRVDQYLQHSSRVRMIVVDNMESLAPYTINKFSGFKQSDFHEYDIKKIPVHQRGKWCTSVWIR